MVLRVLAGAGLFAAGVAVGRGVEVALALDVNMWRWLSTWSRSAGFAGTAAIVAATIAYLAARQNANRQERADRKAQWWARAQWALDLTLSDDEHARTVGFTMLDALASSEWAGEHEADIIAAITDEALLVIDPEDSDAAPDDEAAAAEQRSDRDRPGRTDASDSPQEERHGEAG